MSERMRSGLKFPLKVLSRIYWGITAFRNKLYDIGLLRAEISGIPVISVGNVTAGGNSKTPLCIYIASFLAVAGFRPVIISRGYQGRLHGPYVVTPEDSPLDVGDEPLLMAATPKVTVVIARSRAEGAALVKRKDLGDVIILDDGFQHRKLARNLDIVAVNVGTQAARDAFVAGDVLPAGLFREDRDLALARADAIVFAERRPFGLSEPLDPRMQEIIPAGVSVFRSCIAVEGVFSLADGRRLEKCEVAAFCGLANPEGFFESVSAEGYPIKEKVVFPDHYKFKVGNIHKLIARFEGLPLVCSEKDAVKIPEALHADIYQLKIRTVVDPSDEFKKLLLDVAGGTDTR